MAVTLTAQQIIDGINSAGWADTTQFALAMKLTQLLTKKALLQRQVDEIQVKRAGDNAAFDKQEADGMTAIEAQRSTMNQTAQAQVDALNAQIAAIDTLIHP
jgi:hypothetical protein